MPHLMTHDPQPFDTPTRNASAVLSVPRPYVLFLGEAEDAGWAKTAFGLHDWVPESCIAEIALPKCRVTTGLPRIKIRDAFSMGARSLVIGVAPIGGQFDPSWLSTLIAALESGLDIASGMHTPLASVPELKAVAERTGRQLIDVRRPPRNIPIGTGGKRTGRRLLTMGTDCALGKKYTALSLTRAFRQRGVDADFKASGQTGILIAGSGIPMDAVVADFVAGAAESLSPSADSKHWDVIEGQGSLFHPAYAAVTLGLLHGSQPDILVICHDPRRQEILGCPGYNVPSVAATIDLSLRLGRQTNAHVRCAGAALNTGGMDPAEAERVITALSEEIGLPVADPIRGGPHFDALVDSCLEL
jgi:uncharacterized NAD-dependent epimerase/dehydratase family protein